MFEYRITQKVANKWNISARRIQKLCKEGRIDGVMNVGRVWLIPEDAEKPVDERYKSYRKLNGVWEE